MDIYRFDRFFRRGGSRKVAGVDEAGRGPIAGPVVAAAVMLPPESRIRGLRDSKEMSAREREDVFFEILCLPSSIGVGISDVEEIERKNILEATRVAMVSAVNDLSAIPDVLLIDAVRLPLLKIRQFSPIKGDKKSASIAASSVVAKVVRDRLMEHYHRIYPEFGFDRHKGYATREHVDKVRAMGPCPIHRKTFGVVKSLPLPF